MIHSRHRNAGLGPAPELEWDRGRNYKPTDSCPPSHPLPGVHATTLADAQTKTPTFLKISSWRYLLSSLVNWEKGKPAGDPDTVQPSSLKQLGLCLLPMLSKVNNAHQSMPLWSLTQENIHRWYHYKRSKEMINTKVGCLWPGRTSREGRGMRDGAMEASMLVPPLVPTLEGGYLYFFSITL